MTTEQAEALIELGSIQVKFLSAMWYGLCVAAGLHVYRIIIRRGNGWALEGRRVP